MFFILIYVKHYLLLKGIDSKILMDGKSNLLKRKLYVQL